MLVSDVANPFYGDVIHGVEDTAIAAATLSCSQHEL